MSDPIHFDPGAAGDRQRALELERATQSHVCDHLGLEGARELSQAWKENRSTQYLIRKSWADPLARWMFVVGFSIIAAVWAYLLTQ